MTNTQTPLMNRNNRPTGCDPNYNNTSFCTTIILPYRRFYTYMRTYIERAKNYLPRVSINVKNRYMFPFGNFLNACRNLAQHYYYEKSTICERYKRNFVSYGGDLVRF